MTVEDIEVTEVDERGGRPRPFLDVTGLKVHFKTDDGVVKAVRTLLMDIATTMEALLSAVSTVHDLVTHVLLVPPPGSGICIRRLCLVA